MILTDKEIANAAALLTEILTEYHGHLELLKIDDERITKLRKLLQPIDGNTLKVIIEAWRSVDHTKNAEKGARTRLLKDPDFYRRMSRSRIHKRGKYSKLSPGAN